MRLTVSALVAILVLAPATDARAQTFSDLLASIQRGGGWVAIDIEDGEGHFSSIPMPTVGLSLSGCVQVWEGHSGRWDISARDSYGDGRLEVSTDPGEGVPFTYDPGARSQLEVAFRWSEPRDTTLLLWIGLDSDRRDRDACDPYAG